MRKVRREIMRTINVYRAKFGVPEVNFDQFGNEAADDYAKHLLETNEPNEEILKKICEARGTVGEAKVIVGNAGLEENAEFRDKNKLDEYMDAHGLLLELQHELGMLTAKNITHVGIGFAENESEVKVVEFLTEKSVMVNKIEPADDGGVNVHGFVLNPAVGLYAARIIAKSNPKKDLAVVGPSGI